MSNVVELLTLFLEQVTPSKDLTSEQWSKLISTVKNTLDNSKDYISNSADPLVEGFSTILNAIVANKYSTPGSNYYSALTLSRIGSFSSHSSTDSTLNTSSESETNQSNSFGSSRSFLDRLKDDDKSSTSRSSSESSGRRKGYSALVGTLKRLFLKEKLERLGAKGRLFDDKSSVDNVTEESDKESFGGEERYRRYKCSSQEDKNKLPSKKYQKDRVEERERMENEKDGNESKKEDKNSKDNSNKDKEKENTPTGSNDQVSVTDPYPFRSISPGNLAESNKKGTSRDTNSPESMRLTFRDEIAEKIPPLDLESLKPHDHLTTPGDSDNTTVRLPTTVRNKMDSTLENKSKENNKDDVKNKSMGDKDKDSKDDAGLSKKRVRSKTTDTEHEDKHLKSKSSSPAKKSKSHTSDNEENKEKDSSKENNKDEDKYNSNNNKNKSEKKEVKDIDDKNKISSTTGESSRDEPMTKRPRNGHEEILYKPLITLVDNVSRVNLYVVAVEMIRASVRTIDIRRDVFNYRAIDPSVLNTNNNVDYSVQIMASDPKMAHHINFGDVLRLKRVDANFVVDKSGRKHINIILSLKNKPSMRLWHSTHNKELETERINIDFNKVTDSTRMGFSNNNESNFSGSRNGFSSISADNKTANDNTKDNSNKETQSADNKNKEDKSTNTNGVCKESDGNKDKDKDGNESKKGNKNSKDNNNNTNNNRDKTVHVTNSSRSSNSVRSPMLRDYQTDPDTIEKQIETLKKEALVLFYNAKVTMTPKDVAIINFLKDWSRNLKPLDILGSSEYTKPLTESSNIPQDFIVKVIKVCPDQSLMVADSEAKAIVNNFDQILATNLFESCNPIQKGDWLKLRCFIRVFNDSDRLIKLSATKLSCVTRLPPLNHKVFGEDHLDPDNNHGILVRERRVNLEELSRTSCLNDSFPRRFKRSRDFIHKLLSKQPPVQFQKASPVRKPVEKEEGEISQ